MAPRSVDADSRHKDTIIFSLGLTLVIVSVAFLTTIIVLLAKCYRRRLQKYHTVSEQNSPSLLMHDKKPLVATRSWCFKRTQTLENKVEEEETQREFMIRKSYAKRVSMRTSSQLSRNSGDLEHEGAGADAGGLRDDYKDWEANLHEERCRSPEQHPSLVQPVVVEVDLGVRDAVPQELPPPLAEHPLFAKRTPSLPQIDENDLRRLEANRVNGINHHRGWSLR